MKVKAKDLGINLVESFSEFKEFKNIDRATMMRVLEDVFRNILKKKYGNDANFDIIINTETGDIEMYHLRLIVEAGDPDVGAVPCHGAGIGASELWVGADGCAGQGH